MSISPISSLLSGPPSPAAAVGAQSAVLQTSVGQRTIKDQIDLSKEAISFLAGGSAK